jgi:hypothetical protein
MSPVLASYRRWGVLLSCRWVLFEDCIVQTNRFVGLQVRSRQVPLAELMPIRLSRWETASRTFVWPTLGLALLMLSLSACFEANQAERGDFGLPLVLATLSALALWLGWCSGFPGQVVVRLRAVDGKLLLRITDVPRRRAQLDAFATTVYRHSLCATRVPATRLSAPQGMP